MSGAESVDANDAALSDARTERDALRREVTELRGRLCIALGLLRAELDAEGLEVLVLAGDDEILAAVRGLIADATPATDGTRRRWAAIDLLILRGRRIQAIQQIREEFGGGIHEALEMLVRRYDRLRLDRPDEFAQDHETYWSNFHS